MLNYTQQHKIVSRSPSKKILGYNVVTLPGHIRSREDVQGALANLHRTQPDFQPSGPGIAKTQTGVCFWFWPRHRHQGTYLVVPILFENKESRHPFLVDPLHPTTKFYPGKRIASGGNGSIHHVPTNADTGVVAKRLEGSGPLEEIEAQLSLSATSGVSVPHIYGIHTQIKTKASGPTQIKAFEPIFWILMSKITGRSLAEHIDQGNYSDKSIQTQRIRSIATQVNKIGLTGFVHRDLTPSNIMGTHQQSTMVDFGACKKIGTLVTNEDTTVGYRAPELVYAYNDDCAVPANPAMDWFSFGCVVVEILTRMIPLDAFAEFKCPISGNKETAAEAEEFRRFKIDTERVIFDIGNDDLLTEAQTEFAQDFAAFMDTSHQTTLPDPPKHSVDLFSWMTKAWMDLHHVPDPWKRFVLDLICDAPQDRLSGEAVLDFLDNGHAPRS